MWDGDNGEGGRILKLQALRIPIYGNFFGMVDQMARAAMIGGMSNIRGSQDRKEKLYEDQLTGQLGELALSLLVSGSPVLYLSRRQRINKNPRDGDNGSDLDGYWIDVKTSMIRRAKNPFSYHLVVRPREKHKGLAYILALVEMKDMMAKEADVLFVGWEMSENLPSHVQSSGEFEGAFSVGASFLKPMENFKAEEFKV